ncbi:MAG: hypothetical protein FJX52_07165 [Alphaproteobacteria bacterium]|nr:hypothetical protein [Alphaproteobacteria bacterium]
MAQAMVIDQTQTHGAGRGLLLTNGGMGLAVLVFLVPILLSFQTLFDQKRLIEKESRIDMWFLAQTEIEYLRLMEAVNLFSVSPERMKAEQVIERFEFFWSRLPILLKGPQSAGVRQVDGLVDIANAIVKQLEAIEGELQNIVKLDSAKFWAVHAKLSALQAPLHDMVRRALLYGSEEVSRERSRREFYYYELVAFFAAALIGGVVIFILLLVQVARTRRAGAKARAAEEASTTARTQLEVAIGSISEGFILYDSDGRILLFNERYRDLHPAQANMLAVGVTFEQIMRLSIAGGGIKLPEGQSEDEWVASCVRQHRDPGQPFESRLRNGTWLKISERRTGDGRIVGIYTDITETKERELQLRHAT